jgi:NB-ARC domain
MQINLANTLHPHHPLGILNRQWVRYRSDLEESDTAGFLSLMYMGEATIKVLTCALLGALENDQSGTRYQLAHRLVRADGIGEWVSVLGELSKGPASNLLPPSLTPTRTALSQRVERGQWQERCWQSMAAAASELGIEAPQVATKTEIRVSLDLFVQIRNKTRGHGAVQIDQMSKSCAHLCEALVLFGNNIPLFQTSWAYIKQNLSGKYRVSPISASASEFSYLSIATSGPILKDGIYFWADGPIKTLLIESAPDLPDFYFPNGNLRNEKYESLSYITSSRREIDASGYVRPPINLSPSETEGQSELQVTGDTFTNLPDVARFYVDRTELEARLQEILKDDRHPVITLHGMGGIGKTSLAIKVLHELASQGCYDVIVWLSARDIDLLDHGVKPVRPNILTLDDVACEIFRLINPLLPDDRRSTGKACQQNLASLLGEKNPFKPRLFVLDNFETIRNPVEVFTALSDRIRLPNKLLITTRFRDFRADYPLEVKGMQRVEADTLIGNVSNRLAIEALVTPVYRDELRVSSGGHPYIIKVVLGEVAKRRALTQVHQILVKKDDLLEALFHRAFASLSLLGQRLFLLVASWSSVIPRLAIETVVVATLDEVSNLEGALDDLVRTSLVEEIRVQDYSLLFAPIAAKQFAKQQLKTSQLEPQVREDLTLLQQMGPSTVRDGVEGVHRRLERLILAMLKTVGNQSQNMPKLIPALEYLAKNYPTTWLRLAVWFEDADDFENALRAAEMFIQAEESETDDSLIAWDIVIRCKQATRETLGELNGLCKKACLGSIQPFVFSDTVNLINQIYNTTDAPTEHRRALLADVCVAYEQHFCNASFNSTDFSRIAWLYMHVNLANKARAALDRGLSLDTSNTYCMKLS